jgi:hypothetical protein
VGDDCGGDSRIIMAKPKRGIKPNVFKGQRRDCFGGCGRRIALFYNPSGYCRKCQKRNALRALKLENKRRREQKDGD